MSKQKSVLITGCSAGGIGSSLALSFANHNHLVFATARNISKISPKLADHPNVRVLVLDTTSPSSITAAANAISKETGGMLDYLVNNAGAGLVSPFLDTDLSAARALFDVNFWGVLNCIQGFKTLLVEGGGCIVNVASIAAVAPNPYESIYNASKAALAHFTATIALELKPLGVTTVTVMAGMVQSSWYSNSIPQIQLPEDSYYHSVTDAINAGMQGDDNKKNGTDVDVFAEQVVKSVVNGGRGKLWAGTMAPLVKWVTGWLPVWILEKICSDRGNLGKLASERKKSKGA